MYSHEKIKKAERIMDRISTETLHKTMIAHHTAKYYN